MHPLTFLSALGPVGLGPLGLYIMRFTSPPVGAVSNRRARGVLGPAAPSIDFGISSVPILRHGLVVLLLHCYPERDMAEKREPHTGALWAARLRETWVVTRFRYR